MLGLTLVLGIAFLSLSCVVQSETTRAREGLRDNYKIWCTGNCDGDFIGAETSPGVVLMGGGTDTDEGFIWQISKAGGGDFVVLRTSGDDAYNEWIMGLSIAAGNKLNSVRTILFNNKKGSSESEVLTALGNAEAIFMAGGDQSEYLDYWVGTDVQSIMQAKLVNVTLGGTSAGCAMLGNWVYSGEKGSATSDECLEDPYNKYTASIVPAFLNIPFLETIITDTHFVTRDRMGRMETFVARIFKDNATPSAVQLARGVGVDEHTALLLDVTTGEVNAVGVGTAYVCTSDHQPAVCVEKTPLTFENVQCVRLEGGDSFSFSSFTGGGVAYTNNIAIGHYTNGPYGNI